MPTDSSPERTDDPAELAGREHDRRRGGGQRSRCRSRTTARRPARRRRTAGCRRGGARGRRGGARRPVGQRARPGGRGRSAPSSTSGAPAPLHEGRALTSSAPGDPRAGDQAERAPVVGAGTPQRAASGSPTCGIVSGRPVSPSSSDHGVPARLPDGVSTRRRSPTSGSTGSGPAGGRPGRGAVRGWPRIASANGPARSRGRHVEVGGHRVEQRLRAVGPRRAGAPRPAPAVTTNATSPPSTTTCATSAASVAPSSSRSSVSPAGSPTSPTALAVPAALPDGRGQLVSSTGLGRARRGLPGLQHPELGQVRGHPGSRGGRTGATRPTRARARSDHSRTRSGRPSASADREPELGQVTAVPDQGALQVEAAERRLPRVQVGEPGADVAAGHRRPAAGLGELGLHLLPVQAYGERVAVADPDAGGPRCRGVVELARGRWPAGRPGDAAASVERLVVQRRAGRRPARRASASARESVRTPGRIDAPIAARPSARSARQLAVLRAEAARRPARHHPGPGRVARAAGSAPGRTRTRPGTAAAAARRTPRRRPPAPERPRGPSPRPSAPRRGPGRRAPGRPPRGEPGRRGRRSMAPSASTRSPREQRDVAEVVRALAASTADPGPVELVRGDREVDRRSARCRLLAR